MSQVRNAAPLYPMTEDELHRRLHGKGLTDAAIRSRAGF